MKIINFWGDLTDVTTRKCPLLVTMMICVDSTLPRHNEAWYYLSWGYLYRERVLVESFILKPSVLDTKIIACCSQCFRFQFFFSNTSIQKTFYLDNENK